MKCTVTCKGSRVLAGIVVLLAVSVAVTPTFAGYTSEQWYMNPVTNLAYCQEITISRDIATGNLTNFPVLIVITNQSNPVFAKAQSNGNDIVFATADGQKLAHEFEVYTSSGDKKIVAWVKVPLIYNGAETTLQMCYGNSSMTNQQNKAGVWTNNFLGVWHLNEAVSNGGTNYDSSPSGANAVRYGSGAGGTPGKIGGGNAYNGSDDYSQGNGVAINTNGYSVSAWFYLAATNIPFFIIEAGGNAATYLGIYADRTPLLTVVNAAGGQVGTYSPVISVSNWHYVVGVARPSGGNKLFIDGVDASGTWGDPTGLSLYTQCKYIGKWVDSSDFWNGTLDELRVSNLPESSAWITACYRNQGNPGAYLTVGDETQICQWEYRQKIIISTNMTPNTDQTDFPMLVSITNQANHLFNAARSDGGDILFTASNGVTKLSHEIETYTNSGARQLAAWVKAPVLSHTNDTVFYMYYGNPTAVRQQNPVAVWTNNFLAVWHMSEAPAIGGQYRDSSPSQLHATRYGTAVSGTPGKIAGASVYNGVDDFATTAGALVSTNGYAISAWIYLSQPGHYLIECGNYVGASYVVASYGSGLLSMQDGTSVQRTCGPIAGSLSETNWHHVFAVITPTQNYFYVDGADQTAGGVTPPSGVLATYRAMFIGEYMDGSARWNGMLDEMHVENIPRSADWIATCYNNQNSPNSYMSFSSKQARTGGLVFMFR